MRINNQKYFLSIFVFLLLIGYSIAHYLSLPLHYTDTITFIILLIILIGMVTKSILTLVSIPLLGIFIHNNGHELLSIAHPVWIIQVQSWIHLQFSKGIQDQKLIILCNAMILGDTKEMPLQQKEVYRALSLLHVIAISGMHLHVITFYLRLALFALPSNSRISTYILLTFIWIFSFISNCNPSILRSCADYQYTIIAQLNHRRIVPINKIAASVLVILIISKHLIFNIGFQLSMAAILGIQFVYPYLLKTIRIDNIILKRIWKAICISISAQIMCMPLIAYYTQKIYLQFLLTNLIVSPLFTLLLHLIILFLFFSFIPFMQNAISICLFKTFDIINQTGNILLKTLPHQSIKIDMNWLWLIYTYAFYLIVMTWWQQKRPKMLVYLLLLTCLLRISQCATLGIK